jgi:hypothetical protein
MVTLAVERMWFLLISGSVTVYPREQITEHCRGRIWHAVQPASKSIVVDAAPVTSCSGVV